MNWDHKPQLLDFPQAQAELLLITAHLNILHINCKIREFFFFYKTYFWTVHAQYGCIYRSRKPGPNYKKALDHDMINTKFTPDVP